MNTVESLISQGEEIEQVLHLVEVAHEVLRTGKDANAHHNALVKLDAVLSKMRQGRSESNDR